jgi:type II secretory pathway predicted ATPase ExeA
MIDKLQAHYGFTRMPFGRDLAPGMLHRHAAHNEACARITWCIAERAIGVITGEVGAGKTVSVRTVLASLDASRHTIIYLPNPMIGIRGLHEMIVATFGGQPDRSYSRLTAQASAMLAAERDERGKTPVLVIDEAHLLRYEQLETIRMLTLCRDRAHRPAHPAAHHEARRARRPGAAHRAEIRDAADDQRRNQQLHQPPPQARRPVRPPVQR